MTGAVSAGLDLAIRAFLVQVARGLDRYLESPESMARTQGAMLAALRQLRKCWPFIAERTETYPMARAYWEALGGMPAWHEDNSDEKHETLAGMQHAIVALKRLTHLPFEEAFPELATSSTPKINAPILRL